MSSDASQVSEPPSLSVPVAAQTTGKNRVWEKALSLATRILLPRGHLLHMDDRALNAFYYVESGQVSITYSSKCGRARAILRVPAGSIFNEATALAGYDNPDTQYCCLKDSVLWRFDGALLRSDAFIREYPELIANLMCSLAHKTLTMHQNLSYTGTGSALVQVCRYFLQQATIQGTTTFCIGHGQQELAELLGIHRATLVRALQVLKEKGAIDHCARGKVELKNIKLLETLSEQ